MPELGRKATAVRELFLRYQDRIVFGTDLGVGEAPDDLMLGSTGLLPPNRAAGKAGRLSSATAGASPSAARLRAAKNNRNLSRPSQTVETAPTAEKAAAIQSPVDSDTFPNTRKTKTLDTM